MDGVGGSGTCKIKSRVESNLLLFVVVVSTEPADISNCRGVGAGNKQLCTTAGGTPLQFLLQGLLQVLLLQHQHVITRPQVHVALSHGIVWRATSGEKQPSIFLLELRVLLLELQHLIHRFTPKVTLLQVALLPCLSNELQVVQTTLLPFVAIVLTVDETLEVCFSQREIFRSILFRDVVEVDNRQIALEANKLQVFFFRL
jgi:hypothetical protein